MKSEKAGNNTNEPTMQEQSGLLQEVVRRKKRPKANSELTAAEMDIGARLHQIRKSRHLTLQHMSKATGVSTSAFSKIERNELSPTIGTLQRIATGLDIDLMDLLEGSPSGGLGNYGRRSISRAGGGDLHNTATCANKFLCSDLRHKKMTPIVTRVTARKPEDYKLWAKSEAEVFLMVLEGTMVLHSRLYEPLVLNEGDSIYYDANSEHVWTSQGKKDAKVLWVLVAGG